MDQEDLQEVVIPDQRLDFYDFGAQPLHVLLNLASPPFTANLYEQLTYLARYVRTYFDCKSVLIERHYIDRDYMEDYAAFYSKSVRRIPNFCQRIHFFRSLSVEIRKQLSGLKGLARTESLDTFKKSCADFSRKEYLGFSVIKPLAGCPVGRTVLLHLPEVSEDGNTREFTCTRPYRAHVAGVELTVHGLAFQQQDVGVSACATTAIWSALHKVRDLEEIAAATPAQITTLAAQYTLPFGRAMPSEGLSIDQMCMAVQAFGVSPSLYNADDFNTARGHLYSASQSGIPSVLILREIGSDNYHAVTVVGHKIYPQHRQTLIADKVDDPSGDLVALYIHDDRHGPYLRADLGRDEAGLKFQILIDSNLREPEEWKLTHILIPLHGKIHLSFGDLRVLVTDHLIPAWHAAAYEYLKSETTNSVTFQVRLLQPNTYAQELLRDQRPSMADLNVLLTTIPFSRYLGIVRLTSELTEPIEVLIDTTSTMRNVTCLGVFPMGHSDSTRGIAANLALYCQCRVLAE